MTTEPEHQEHKPDQHGHHGHHNDRGLKAFWRYLKNSRRLWRSAVNDAVVAEIDPQPGERVLDIGAGVGAAVVVAARRGPAVVAVEPTPFLRRVLQVRRLVNSNRSRISIVDAAAEDLRIDDSSVDAVWAVNSMHHWVDQRAAAAELARVARPGARVFLVDEDFRDPAHPDAARRSGDHGPHRHGFTAVDADSMGQLLIDAGFESVKADKQMLIGRPVIAVAARRPG